MAADWKNIFDIGQWQIRVSYGDGEWYTPETLPSELGSVTVVNGEIVCFFTGFTPIGYYQGAPTVECVALSGNFAGKSARLSIVEFAGLDPGDTYRYARFGEGDSGAFSEFEQSFLPESFSPNPIVIDELTIGDRVSFTYVPKAAI